MARREHSESASNWVLQIGTMSTLGRAFGLLRASLEKLARGGKAGLFDRLNRGIDSSPLADRSHYESKRVSSADSSV
jgi:hypothetical protein